MSTRQLGWGLAGLLVFEAMIAGTAATQGWLDFFAWYTAGAIPLAIALLRLRLTEEVDTWVLVALAAVTLPRAMYQTLGQPFAIAWVPTYLVPAGFTLAAIASWQSYRTPTATYAAGIGLVALGRTWFIAHYFAAGTPIIAVANIAGALGAAAWVAWLWRA